MKVALSNMVSTFSIKQEYNSLFLCKFARFNNTFVKEQI